MSISYEFNNKIKNKNIGYFLIGGMAFSSLRKAEGYCHTMGYDVNKIMSEDEDVFNECRDIAHSNLRLLTLQRRNMDATREELLSKANKSAEAYEESIPRRDLLREWKNDVAREDLGVLMGFDLAMRIADEQIENCVEILRVSGWRG
jgi:hypothetical protein